MVRRLGWVLLLLVFASGCTLQEAPLIAQFTMDPDGGTSPLLVFFDASGSVADGGVASYAWDFGDGSTGAGPAMAHLFTTGEAKTYQVTLTITGHTGRQAQASRDLTVLPPSAPPEPEVGFIWPFHFDASGEDAANLNDEYFTLLNLGTTAVDMSGWTVENERGLSYRFPDGFELAAGAYVFVHSGTGVDTAAVLYWGAAEPVWNDSNDIAILRNADGDIVDVYAYASC